jgi:DNA-binding MarR family transcriptional regulator
MQEIGREGEICSSRLTVLVHLTQPTVTTILDRLENKNIIRRIRSGKDKRKVLISLTETGKTLLAGVPSPLKEDFIDKWNNLSRYEQQSLLINIRKIAEMLSADNSDSVKIPQPLIEERV